MNKEDEKGDQETSKVVDELRSSLSNSCSIVGSATNSNTDNSNTELAGSSNYREQVEDKVCSFMTRSKNSLKKSCSHESLLKKKRLKNHELAPNVDSVYLTTFDITGDQSDNDRPGSFSHDASISAISQPFTFNKPFLTESLMSNKSLCDTNQTAFTQEGDENTSRTESISWMNQIWKSINNATDSFFPSSIVSSHRTTSTESYSILDRNDLMNRAFSTFSSFYSKLYFPLFTTQPDPTNNSITAVNPNDKHKTNHLPKNMAIIPGISSRFKFAMKRQNPYQIVIGRDTDLLLASNTSSFFWSNYFSLTSWLSWIKDSDSDRRLCQRNDDAGNQENYSVSYKAVQGRKGQLSDVSVDAIKNLLFFVRNQVDSQEFYKLQKLSKNASCASSNISDHDGGINKKCQERRPLLEASFSFDSYSSTHGQPLKSYPDHVASNYLPPDRTERLSSRSSSSMSQSLFEEARINWDSKNSSDNNAMHAEMAARLAEGILRAYRDLVLDEAAHLHSALHHWTLRWERPFLGWLEAGPGVWFFSEKGYSPYEAGKKVSQIQAVLARRCAVIGEIQQHIWRATWSKGVAEWGMLGGGIGGEWTAVVGGNGGIENPGSSPRQRIQAQSISTMKIFHHPLLIGKNVSNLPGGCIAIDQDAQVYWSINAIQVIRDQLYRASPGTKALPFFENWPREVKHFQCDDNPFLDTNDSDMPLWAGIKCDLSDSSRAAADFSLSVGTSDPTEIEIGTTVNDKSNSVVIDLPKMADEVSSLLQTIEISLYRQSKRRLDRLRPPSRLRRNWYLFAIGVPVLMYVGFKLTKEHGGFYLLKQVVLKVTDIYRDHVSEPLFSIYQELFTKSGRLNVTDRKARIDAIDSLKRMIRSWLDESFPKMPTDEKVMRSESMDISLIEQSMEQSIKYITEINSVVRMSLIEMQFIKKELLNALVAMDELIGSNEINMRIAAMTPAVILLLAIKRSFHLVFYAILRLGKSKEDIYASVRQTMLDIERLLVMRDNPPPPPESLPRSYNPRHPICEPNKNDVKRSQTLTADDLGMLLLHIHECRQIIWGNRRRFRGDLLRNMTEDLSELAGERGPVSISQQLHIVNRMSRVYSFMKPRSMFGSISK